ncbi:hypothetical protein V5O48_009514 [Marasmius crinis-equi]|uniref:F-box domain-containing protein n=1 Tax=Marasmius crinis-equi TaxID=585013 RepID=A0ABR3FAW1_9AGAR
MDRLPPELHYRILDFCTAELYDSSASNGSQRQPPPTNNPPRDRFIAQARLPWRNNIPATDDPSGMPWTVSQVCKPWRSYLLSNPRLWSFISITFAGVSPPDDDPYEDRFARIKAKLERLRQQLRRASNEPLTVVIRLLYSCTNEGDRILFPLCCQAFRWRDLRIQLDKDRAKGFSAIKGLLPSLESLDITCLGSKFEQEVSSFEIAPRLTKLVLSGDHCLANGTTALRLPFDQITDFAWYDDTSSASPGWRPAHEILSRLQNLEKCRISVHPLTIEAYRNDSQHDAEQPFVSFSGLQQLELIENRGISGIDGIFPWIRAPSLTSLTVSSSGRTRTSLCNFLTFADSLRSLTIHDVETSPHEFGALLSGLTSLKALSFGVAGGITRDYLGLFCEKEAGTDAFLAVPRLEKLTLYEVKDVASSYEEDSLLDVLEARRRNPGVDSIDSQMRLACVDLARNVVTDEARTRLNRLRAEGLRVLLPPVVE